MTSEDTLTPGQKFGDRLHSSDSGWSEAKNDL
jgi:hypothetical protein